MDHKHHGVFSREDLVKRGYTAATKAEIKTFELPDFVPTEDYRYLPLHIQVRFAEKPVDVQGADVAVHLRKVH